MSSKRLAMLHEVGFGVCFLCVAGEGESWWRRVLCRGASGGGTSYEGRPRKGRHLPGLILRNAEVVFSHFSYFALNSVSF